MKSRALKRVGVALAACVAGLVVAEVALRVCGFEFAMRPETIEFGGPTREQIRTSFVEDPDVFWVDLDYAANLVRLRGTHPRIVFMGDSCTQLMRYDDAFARRVEHAAGGRPLAFGTVGVAGWSSWQGRRQLERDVLPLRPRIVTIYFGWNDHWVGYGIEDKKIARLRDLSSPFLESLRLGQLVTKLRVARELGSEQRPNRVSEDDFRDNLTTMVREARARQVVPVLLTAPSAHVEGTTPSELLKRWLRRPEDLVPLHRRYADIVREVARAESAPLCDLETAMHANGQGELDSVDFMADGIHPTEAGAERIGNLLFDAFERQGLLKLLAE